MKLERSMHTAIRALTLAFVVAAMPVCADGQPPAETQIDQRTLLNLTPEERTVFLAEMRQMLASIQGILRGLGDEDREAIAEAARRSGNRMARATPASVRAKLPPSFRDIGGPTHLMFEELVIRAETDDMDMLAHHTGELMNQCMACHATFRVR